MVCTWNETNGFCACVHANKEDPAKAEIKQKLGGGGMPLLESENCYNKSAYNFCSLRHKSVARVPEGHPIRPLLLYKTQR